MPKLAVVKKWVIWGMLSGLVLIIAACSDDRAPTAEITADNPTTPVALFDAVWRVEDIDRGGIIDSSHITMQLSAEGPISGSTGCNQYFGSLSVDASAFQVDGSGSTRKACVPAIMQQEQRFLQALQDVRRYEVEGETVRLYDATGNERIQMIRTIEEPLSMSAVHTQDRMDPTAQQTQRFECDGGPVFEVRFVEASSLTLSLDGEDHLLQYESAASGAKYSDESLVFWNEGDNAVLEVGGVEYECR